VQRAYGGDIAVVLGVQNAAGEDVLAPLGDVTAQETGTGSAVVVLLGVQETDAPAARAEAEG
jgi:hypothetical protein